MLGSFVKEKLTSSDGTLSPKFYSQILAGGSFGQISHRSSPIQ